MASDREKCIKIGCDEYVTKPIETRVLLPTVARLARIGAELRSRAAPTPSFSA
jgi:CheY-like chemotaxis protein